MADSVCGPSNAGKSLVNHFDRNRSMQQDRFTNASPAQNNTSFRSSPHPARSDAAFEAFQSQTLSSPLPTMQITGLPLNMQSTGQPLHPAGMAAPPSWVRDFQSMRLSNGSPQQMDPGFHAQNGTAMMHDAHNSGMAAPNAVQTPLQSGLGPQSMFGNPYAAAERNMPALSPGIFLGVQQLHQSPTPMQQESSTLGEYSHYPQNIALSHSTEEALDAAFAAYDQDFEHEMHQWMDTHGPKTDNDLNMAEVEVNMEAIADEQDMSRLRRERQEKQQQAQGPIDDGATSEFRKAAMDILDTVGKNQGEKFKNSSFLELMRRICEKEVVLQGDNLIDTKTGTVLGDNSVEVPESATASSEIEVNGKVKDAALH